jgi:hypothetical protein
MKVFSVVIFFILCCFNIALAQDYNKNDNKYKVWVTLPDKPYEVNGTLYELRDSTLLVSHYKTFSEFIVDDSPTIELHINNIDLIETRKRNRIGMGILIGAVSGFTVGGLIGLTRAADAEQTTGQKALIGGASLAIPGALVGLLVGSVKVVIPIEGSILKYKDQRLKLQKYSTK